MQGKECTRCGNSYPLTTEYFHRRSLSKDGHHHYCKTCVNSIKAIWRAENLEKDRQAKKRYREKNPEKAQKAVRQWMANNPERFQAGTSAWRKQNPERVLGYNRKYHANNPGVREQWNQLGGARWYKNNKERKCASVRDYRGRRRVQTGAASERVSFKAIMLRDKSVCGICHQMVEAQDREFDHVIPLSRGGSHTADNIQVAHARCNRRKQDKTPEEFAAYIALLSLLQSARG